MVLIIRLFPQIQNLMIHSILHLVGPLDLTLLLSPLIHV